MYKTILRILTAGLIMAGLGGCGNDSATKGKEETLEKKVDVSKRKAVLTQKIEMLKGIGFDLNKSIDTMEQTHYTIEVRDADLVTSALLAFANSGTAASRDRKRVAKLIKNLKRAELEIDWKKYANNMPKSLFLWLRGIDKEKPLFRKLMQEKKLGLYLSYDENDQIKRVDIKDIDEVVTRGVEKVTLQLKGAHVSIEKAPTETSPSRKMDFQAGVFRLVLEENGVKTADFSYENPNCQMEKSNAYLGLTHCTVPKITFSSVNPDSNGTFDITLHDTKSRYEVVEHDGKIKGDGTLAIKTIDYMSHNRFGGGMSGTVSQVSIQGVTDNVSQKDIEALYQLASKVKSDNNQSIEEAMKLVASVFTGGTDFTYTFGIDAIEGKMERTGQTDTFAVVKISDKGLVTFDNVITAHDETTIEHIHVTKEGGKSTLFDLKQFRWTSELKNLYNFIPDFFAFAARLADKDPAASLPEEEKKRLTAMGTKIVNHGASFSYDPISIEGVKVNELPIVADYSAMHLSLHTLLKKNTVTFDNSMSTMMLLQYLQADGKLVLDKKDLEQMSKDFSPQIMAMVMMYAKYEGGKAIFALKFENGHLMINNKPIM